MGRHLQRLPIALAAACVTFWLLQLGPRLVLLPGGVSISALLLGLWAASLVLAGRTPRSGWTLAAIVVYFAARGQWIEALAALWLLASVAERRDLRVLEAAFVAALVIIGGLAVHFALTWEWTPYTAAQRFGGPMGDPNELGQLAVVGALVPLAALERARGLRLAAYVGLLGLAVAAVMASHSRAAVAVLAALLAAMAVRWWRLGRRDLVVAAGMLLAVGLALAPDRFWYRLSRLLSGEDTGHRLELAARGWELFLAHPWLGVGTGAFAGHAGGLTAHNLAIEVLAEGGLLRAIPFALAAALVVRDGWRAWRGGGGGLALAGPLGLLLALTGYMDVRTLAVLLATAPLTASLAAGKTPSCSHSLPRSR